MPARIAAVAAGFAVIAAFAALPELHAGEIKTICKDGKAPHVCPQATDPVETGTIRTPAAVGLLLDNSELVLPGMTLQINRPVKLRRADAVL